MKRLLISILLFICLQSLSALDIYGNVHPATQATNKDEISQIIKKYKSTRVLICGDNDIAVEMNIEMFNLLRFNKEGEQISVSSDTLPPVCSINNIKYLALDGVFTKYNLSFINKTEQVSYLSPFDFIKSHSEKLGESAKNGFKALKYQIKLDRQLLFPSNSMAIMNNGNEKILIGNEKVSFENNYYLCDQDTILAIWQDAPNISLYDIYNEMKKSVSTTPTMGIFIDGLGYHVLENYALKRGLKLSELGFSPTRSVFPSKTQYCYYALGSGQYYDKKHPGMIFTDSVFTNGIIIEEAQTYHNSPLKIILNNDLNDNKLHDDEIFNVAKKELKNHYNFTFIHFHSIDDVSHQYGPYNEKTLEQIDIVFDYINKLSKKFKGNIILFSDHGQHYENSHGNHGSTQSDDIIGVYKYVKN